MGDQFNVDETGITQRGGSVANPYTPTVIGSLALADIVWVKVVGSYAYVLQNGITNLLAIIDISVPTAPTLVSTLSVGTQPVEADVAGRYLYVADDGDDNLKIVDVSDPASPAIVGTLAMAAALSSISVSGKYAYLIESTAAVMKIVDVSDPTAPVLINTVSVTAPDRVTVSGAFAYICGGAGGVDFTILNISNPISVGIVGTLTLTALQLALPLVVSGKYVFVPNTNATPGTVLIIDVEDSATPALIGTASLTGTATVAQIRVAGSFLYVTSDATPSAVWVFDISAPTAPALIGQLDVGTTLGALDILGSNVYVGDATDDLFRVIDITGLDVQSAKVGSLEAGVVDVLGDVTIGREARVRGSLAVGESANIDGDLAAQGTVSAGRFAESNRIIQWTSEEDPTDTANTDVAATLVNSAVWDNTNKLVTLTPLTAQVQSGQLEYVLNPGETVRILAQFSTELVGSADAFYIYVYNTAVPTVETELFGGYIVAYDEFQGEIQLFFNGTSLATFTGEAWADGNLHDAEVIIDRNLIRVLLDGVVVIDFTDVWTRDLTGTHMGCGARIGSAATNAHDVKRFSVWNSTGELREGAAIYGLFSDSTTQAPSSTAPVAVTFDTDVESNGITHASGSSDFTVQHAGVYVVTFNPEIGKTSGAVKTDLEMFPMINRAGAGFANEPDSNSVVTIKDADRQQLMTIMFTLTLAAGDQFRVMQRVDTISVGLGMIATAAVTTGDIRPAIPSIIMNIHRIGAQ